MGSLFKQYKTDKKIEVDGIWVDFPKNDNGTVPQFLIARVGPSNPKYVAAYERHSKPYRTQIRKELLSEELSAKVLYAAFADGCVHDWRNVQDAEGNNLPYTRENVIWLFNQLPDLYNDLYSVASNYSTYAASGLESDAKN